MGQFYFKDRKSGWGVRRHFLTKNRTIGTYSLSVADARLLPVIRVSPDGTTDVSVSTSVVSHDVTGGIETKLTSAIDIVLHSQGSIPVFICAIDSPACETTCLHGHLNNESGTMIRMLWKSTYEALLTEV